MATQPTLMIAMSARLRANTTEFDDALPLSLSVAVTSPPRQWRPLRIGVHNGVTTNHTHSPAAWDNDPWQEFRRRRLT